MRVISGIDVNIIDTAIKLYRDIFKIYQININLDITSLHNSTSPATIDDIGKSIYSILIRPEYNYKSIAILQPESEWYKTLITSSVKEYIENYLRPRVRYYTKANSMYGVDIATIRNNLYAIFKNEVLPQLQDKLIQAKPEYASEISESIAFFSQKRNFIREVQRYLLL